MDILVEKMKLYWKELPQFYNRNEILGLVFYKNKITLLYIPSFRKLCLAKYSIESEYLKKYDDLAICDFRDFGILNDYKEFLHIINPQYKAIMETFYADKDDKIVDIFKESYRIYFTNQEPYLTKDEFYLKLTHAEQKAFESVREGLKGGKKTVNISKLMKESKVSRPVYNSLIVKLKEYKIAHVTNKGAGGTEIIITNPYLKV